MAVAIRQMVADEIKAAKPLYTVKAYPIALPPNLTNVYVSVYRESVTDAPQLAAVTESLKIIVVTPKINSEVAESELEDALDAVLTTVQNIPGIQWSDAQRVTTESNIGYEINLIANTENPYKPSA